MRTQYNHIWKNIKLFFRNNSPFDPLLGFHVHDHFAVFPAFLVSVVFVDEKDEKKRVKKYLTFIKSLPKINRSTLEALLQHLYR